MCLDHVFVQYPIDEDPQWSIKNVDDVLCQDPNYKDPPWIIKPAQFDNPMWAPFNKIVITNMIIVSSFATPLWIFANGILSKVYSDEGDNWRD